MQLQGSFTFLAIDGAEVRLKSGSSGLMNVEVKAPVRSGSLHIVDSIATMELVLALDKLKPEFLTEAAARTFIGRIQRTRSSFSRIEGRIVATRMTSVVAPRLAS